MDNNINLGMDKNCKYNTDRRALFATDHDDYDDGLTIFNAYTIGR